MTAPRYTRTPEDRAILHRAAHIRTKERSAALRDRRPNLKVDRGRLRDQDYQGWLHDQDLPCIACTRLGRPDLGGGFNPMEVAHIRLKGWKKGVRGDDCDSLILCHWHHQAAPNACDKGQRAFFERLDVDAAALCGDLYAAFRGGYDGMQAVLEHAGRQAPAPRVADVDPALPARMQRAAQDLALYPVSEAGRVEATTLLKVGASTIQAAESRAKVSAR
jgi:hypothetical protein